MKSEDRPTQISPPEGSRVLIVDDHPFLRMGLVEALRKEPGLSVCGESGSVEEALLAIEKLNPDVVVADLNLPGRSGMELIKEIAHVRPGLPVVVLSMHDEEIYAERCLRGGARGYVMKSEGPEKLATAIREVLAGEVHVSAKTSARILKSFTGGVQGEGKTALGSLTGREFELFQCLGTGLSTQEIAERLHISVKTVETHRMHIKSKLGVASATELIAYAARWAASSASGIS